MKGWKREIKKLQQKTKQLMQMKMQIGAKYLKQIRMDVMKENKNFKCDMNETKRKQRRVDLK